MSTTATDTTTRTLSGTYEIDPTHSRIGFAAKHAMVTTVRGQFASYTADVRLDEDNPANSRIRVEIDPASITSGNDDRDAHLRSGDFFEVEKFPTIVFESTKVEKADDDVYSLIGNLTIKGKTQP